MRQYNDIRFPKGFTLVELIVVIAIIGILAAFIITNFGSVLAKARDSERINSLKQIQTALELYHANNGEYPKTDSVGGSKWRSARSGGRWIPELTEKYIKKMPLDPKNGSDCSASTNGVRDAGASCHDLAYYSAGFCGLTGQGYLLSTRLEATDTTEFSQKTIIDPTTGSLCTNTCSETGALVTTWSECPKEGLYVLVNP